MAFLQEPEKKKKIINSVKLFYFIYFISFSKTRLKFGLFSIKISVLISPSLEMLKWLDTRKWKGLSEFTPLLSPLPS